jgi:hypothetical protein
MEYEFYPFFSNVTRSFGGKVVYFPVGLSFARLDYRDFEPTGECVISQMVRLLTDIGSVNFYNGLVSKDNVSISVDILNSLFRSAGSYGKKIPDSSVSFGAVINNILHELSIKPHTPRYTNARNISLDTKEPFTDWAVEFVNSLICPLDKG